jgi:hypothetical protein
MTPTDEKIQAYRAATDLLKEGQEYQLPYVALELRRCIEALVYEKLGVYEKWISEKLARTWQPPQAFKALLEIDPGGHGDAVIAVGAQQRPNEPPEEPMKTPGVDRRPDVKWLTDTWNKLGSHLHANWPYSRRSKAGNRRDFYDGVVSELEPFISSHFTAAMTNTIDCPCSECDHIVVISEHGLKSAGYATCLSCWLRYSHREQEGSPRFFLEEPAIECDECHQQVYLPSAELKDGYEFQCRRCKTRFRAVVNSWGIQRWVETRQ